MTFYKVPYDKDNYRVVETNRRTIYTFIGNELYTEKELKNKGLWIYSCLLDKVEINKHRTYWSFGCRFEVKE